GLEFRRVLFRSLSPTIITKEKMNWVTPIMGLTKGIPSESPHILSMMANMPTASEKPTNPAKVVKTMASKRICRLTIVGVAPRARRTPISWVLSLTVIKRMLLMAITPARRVSIPTIREKPCRTMVKALILLNISDMLKLPMARSSLGWMLYLALRMSLIWRSTWATWNPGSTAMAIQPIRSPELKAFWKVVKGMKMEFSPSMLMLLLGLYMPTTVKYTPLIRISSPMDFSPLSKSCL